MRLLHILEAMGGGTRRHVLDLLPALVRSGHEVTLAVSPRRNWPERETFAADVASLEARGVAVRCIEMPRGLSGGWRAVRELAALVKQEQPDVIHCHSTVAGALGRLARLASPRTPLVYTPHCIAFDTGLPRLQRRAGRWIELLLAPLASRYIAVSNAESKSIRRLLRRRAVVIHNGIDLAEFDAVVPQSRPAWGLGEEDFVIGCFGRLCPQKNQLALIQALQAIMPQVPNARLLLVGDGEERVWLQEQAHKKQLGHAVVFAGEHAEARGFYALCDLVAQPSRWEGCPYSVLEAMAAGRPVVARGVGGIPELVDDRAGSVYRSADALAGPLMTALCDAELRSRRGLSARMKVEAGFTLAAMVEKTESVYTETVRRRPC